MSAHRYVTVHGGERYCDEHDSAYPCPVHVFVLSSAAGLAPACVALVVRRGTKVLNQPNGDQS